MYGTSRRRLTRLWKLYRRFLWLFAGLLVLDTLVNIDFFVKPTRISPSSYRPYTPKIFIASTLQNNEHILRQHWNSAVVDLTRNFGIDNVYISVYESGSIDNTKGALHELDSQLADLGASRSIIMDDHDIVDEISREVKKPEPGWIWTGERYELRKIPYLANKRNQVLKKLYDQRDLGQYYDIILWIDAVLFTTEDITTLLATRKGNFDAVCSLESYLEENHDNSFALRDSKGNKPITNSWPYFLSSESRKMLVNNHPVPVRSCWSGLTAFKAHPFYDQPPLQFRAVPDSLAKYHLEGSEGCLIHADNHLENNGVWINPNVRLSSKPSTYSDLNYRNRVWPSCAAKVIGFWKNRLARWLTWPRNMVERQEVRKRGRIWLSKNTGSYEPGFFCLIDDTKVVSASLF